MTTNDTIGSTVGKGIGVVVSSTTVIASSVVEQLSPLQGSLMAIIGLCGSLAFFISLCFDIERKWRRRRLEIQLGKIISGDEK